MADNIEITPGSGITVATDEIAGVQHQQVKIEFGEDGTATAVTASDPLPTTISGVATSEKQDTGNASLESLEGKIGEVQESPTANTVLDRLKQINEAIVAGSGETQYTEGDIDTTPTGTLMMFQASGTDEMIPVADGTPLPVDINTSVEINDGDGSITVDGAVSIGAGTSLIGQVSASGETSTVYNGTTALTPKFAPISASASGNNTIVAAVSSKKIRVLAYNFIANGTVNVKFQSGASGTDLTGLKYCSSTSGIVAPYNEVGWFETASNTLLNINLSAAVAIGGELVYVEV